MMNKDRTTPKTVRPQPTPPLTLADAQVRQADAAIHLDILLRDARGKLWRHHTSAFLPDLETDEEAEAIERESQAHGWNLDSAPRYWITGPLAFGMWGVVDKTKGGVEWHFDTREEAKDHLAALTRDEN